MSVPNPSTQRKSKYWTSSNPTCDTACAVDLSLNLSRQRTIDDSEIKDDLWASVFVFLAVGAVDGSKPAFFNSLWPFGLLDEESDEFFIQSSLKLYTRSHPRKNAKKILQLGIDASKLPTTLPPLHCV